MQSERKNITQPTDWWAAFEKEAARKKLTLSEWIGQVCRAALSNKEWVKLSERPPAHRPKKEKQ